MGRYLKVRINIFETEDDPIEGEVSTTSETDCMINLDKVQLVWSNVDGKTRVGMDDERALVVVSHTYEQMCNEVNRNREEAEFTKRIIESDKLRWQQQE